MRQPQTLDEAKAIFREEKAKVLSSLSAIAGSRWLTAILATLVIAFGVNLLYSPSQLPTLGGFSLAAVGLPESIDFGVVGEQAREAREAAEREELGARSQSWAEANPQYVPAINAAGAGGALVLLLVNMAIMTKRRRYTRG